MSSHFIEEFGTALLALAVVSHSHQETPSVPPIPQPLPELAEPARAPIPHAQIGIWTVLEAPEGCALRAEFDDRWLSIRLPASSDKFEVSAASTAWARLPFDGYMQVIGKSLAQPDWAAIDDLRWVHGERQGPYGVLSFELSPGMAANRLLIERPYVLTPAHAPSITFSLQGAAEAWDVAARCTDNLRGG